MQTWPKISFLVAQFNACISKPVRTAEQFVTLRRKSIHNNITYTTRIHTLPG